MLESSFQGRIDPPRVLVISRDAAAIGAAIGSRRGDLDLRVRTPDRVEPGDGADRNILVCFRVPEVLQSRMPVLAWVQSTGAGVDGIVSWERLPAHVVISRLTDVFGESMSDHVLARLFAWLQELPRLERERVARSWRHFVPRRFRDLRVVVLGAGSIGAEVARRLRANGAAVVGVTRRGGSIEGIEEAYPISELRRALAGADALVVLVPRTRETEGMVGERELALLAPGAFLVNVSRGATIDHDALVRALDRGHLSGAALDVFDVEPLPAESGLWAREDLMISPHVAAVTAPWMVADALLTNLDRASRGEALAGLVDRERGY